MKINTDTQEDGEMINLTPLIDVVFLLLIFFMVTAVFQDDERDLSISVPEAESGDPITELPEIMFVSVNKEGRISIGGQDIDKDELRRVLTRAKRKNEKQRVVVRADRDAKVGATVVVLDVCAALKIETSLGTTPTAEK